MKRQNEEKKANRSDNEDDEDHDQHDSKEQRLTLMEEVRLKNSLFKNNVKFVFNLKLKNSF